MKKLILFGDSLIANFHKADVSTLENNTGYQVYNCATCGWDTNDGVVKAPYIARLQPEVVVFSFGTNDSSTWQQLEIATVAENVKKIIEDFSGSVMIFLLPPPIDEDRQELKKQRSNATIKQYAEAIKNVLIQNNIRYIDPAVFRQILDSGQDYHEEDGIHFNDLGYGTVINEIVKILRT
ncbi:MAG: GDSL-type esterase/lipase family protein [Candidatus Berkelbacteria bacterium]|nr:GDSL-type esterase/lipase family protein [Candidatus Berkelbacteria bacterium]MCR4307561.1 GDSL-type esterase/lipase family protein [Candidatus Berkelbacteria bacterium]